MSIVRIVQSSLLLLPLLGIVNANLSPTCDSNRYGQPPPGDCAEALSSIVPSVQDKDVRYFVEQQLRSTPQSPVWKAFQDPRGAQYQDEIVQLPKWVSHGKCNVAIYSFRHGRQLNSAPSSQWSKIFEQGKNLGSTCVFNKNEGGAAIVLDENNSPGLGIYMWADGANFQFVVNQEMGDMYPFGMDPTITNDDPDAVDTAVFNKTLPAELKVGNTSKGYVQDLSVA